MQNIIGKRISDKEYKAIEEFVEILYLYNKHISVGQIFEMMTDGDNFTLNNLEDVERYINENFPEEGSVLTPYQNEARMAIWGYGIGSSFDKYQGAKQIIDGLGLEKEEFDIICNDSPHFLNKNSNIKEIRIALLG